MSTRIALSFAAVSLSFAAAQHAHAQTYQPYTKAAFDAAQDQRRVLFFHASWCPTCRSADRDLTASLAALPNNVVVFKVDYDKETAMKRRYNVTYQHTFVLVDRAGKALKTWSGGAAREIAANVRAAR